MILPRHPNHPGLSCRAIGYWRIPLDPDRVAEAEAIIAGGGTAVVGRYRVTGSVQGSRHLLAEMREEAALPDPRDFVNPAWAASERAAVVDYLKRAPRVASWLGWSDCRFCGNNNGTTCLSDGVFVWPAGFAHYLVAHDVRPPAEFVAPGTAGVRIDVEARGTRGRPDRPARPPRVS